MLRRNRRDLFDLLAQYDGWRETLLGHAAAADESFAGAYVRAAGLAEEIAGALAEDASVSPLRSINPNTGIRLKILFLREDSAAGSFNFTVQPDEQSRSIMERLGIRIGAVTVLSGSTADDVIAFEVKLQNLPIYECSMVKPYVWILQNENLFSEDIIPVSSEFLFQTEKVSAETLMVSAQYTNIPEWEAASAAEAVQQLWNLLQLDTCGKIPAVSCVYSYAVPSAGGRLFVRIPAIFLPEAEAPETVAMAFEQWLKEQDICAKGEKITFSVQIYRDDEVRMLVGAECTAVLSRCAERFRYKMPAKADPNPCRDSQERVPKTQKKKGKFV